MRSEIVMRHVCLSLLTFSFLILCGCLPDQNDNPGKSSVSETPKEMVRYGMIGAKIRGLDPMDIGDTTSSGVASNFYDSLFQYHYLKRPYSLIPCVAAAMPTYSDDKLTLTIPIRKDVYFHDDPCFPDGKGRQVTAEDFIYSWKRIAYVKNVSKNWWLLEDRIVGLNGFRELTKSIKKEEMDYRQPVEGLKAIDSHTLEIKLTKPVPDIEFRLAHLPTAVVPREAVEKYKEDFNNKVVGTGAFRLAEWVRGSRLVMERNPSFREEFYPSEGEPGDKEKGLLDDAGQKLPILDRFELTVVVEDQPYWLNFMKGYADKAGIPKDNFDNVITSDRELTEEMKEKGIILTKFSEPTTFWLGFNMDDPVVGKNLALRRAMNLALDRKRYIKLFTNNRGVAAKGPLPPSLSAYNKDLKSPYTTFDLKLAKQKVEEAKAFHKQVFNEDLPEIKIAFPGTDATSSQMANFHKRCYEAAGLEIKIEKMEWPAFQDVVHAKKAQVFQMGWIMDWPDPMNMMLLWHGPYESPGANGTNYKDKDFDAMYTKANVMAFGPERTSIIHQMEQKVVDDLPNLFMVHRNSFELKYDWVKNSKPHVFGYGLAKYGRIDQKKRYEKIGR